MCSFKVSCGLHKEALYLPLSRPPSFLPSALLVEVAIICASRLPRLQRTLALRHVQHTSILSMTRTMRTRFRHTRSLSAVHAFPLSCSSFSLNVYSVLRSTQTWYHTQYRLNVALDAHSDSSLTACHLDGRTWLLVEPFT